MEINGQNNISVMSKQWLSTSLLSIMKQKSYESITVMEIAKNADLSRRTFYRFFRNKNELLKFVFECSVNEYFFILQQTIEQKTMRIEFNDIIKIFLNFWWNHRELAQILIQQNLFSRLFAVYSNYSDKMYHTFKMPWHIEENDHELGYVFDFFLGGYINIVSRWLMDEKAISPNELTRIIYDAIKKI
ncbi:TetR/AcrR family transcriptional regulator [Apilactobacillus quenuiae]|uniref:TetR/AcrR family transcriptional regulator n=1 Tax=Apilactobacillus quenuiae TaxID=2008377 RepID=UPI000D015ABA|nr:TetR/AcrR family transcriptional regulator [Apilactobacillus quenuiae]